MEIPTSIYQPLYPASGHIRLLDIHPSDSSGSQLCCTLRPARIQYNGYEALSYTWGDPRTVGSPILLNGQWVKTLENLTAALYRLRDVQRVRTFWIDAICINQKDDHEKGQQVAQMDEIYKNASLVTVWLGEPEYINDHSAMRELQEPGWYPKPGSLAAHERVTNLYTRHGLQRGFVQGWRAKASGEEGHNQGTAVNGQIAQLLDRPYWRRVWIIQEIALAHKLVVMCGPETVSWESMRKRLAQRDPQETSKWNRFQGLMKESARDNLEAPLGVCDGVIVEEPHNFPDVEFWLLDSMQQARESGSWQVTLYDLLWRFRRFNCTNPKDRVYGFLGLVSEREKASISPQYNLSTSEVYMVTARSLMAAHGHLLVLNCRREHQHRWSAYQDTHLYSKMDQGRFIDPHAQVFDKRTGDCRKGWARLPEGWERVVEDEQAQDSSWGHLSGKKKWGLIAKDFIYTVQEAASWYINHSTNPPTKQSSSPLLGYPPVPTGSYRTFQQLPQGWEKNWDNLGRTKFTYKATAAKPLPTLPDANLSDLPSWVPNWNDYNVRDPEPFPDLVAAEPSFWASGLGTPICWGASSDSNPSVLALRGLLFDQINTLAPPWHLEAHRPPLSRLGVAVLEQWERLALSPTSQQCPYHHLPGGRQEAFFRTHIADRPGNPATADDEYLFNVWRNIPDWMPTVADVAMNEHSALGLNLMTAESALSKKLPSKIDMVIPEEDTWRGLKRDFMNSFNIPSQYKTLRKRIYRASANRAMFVSGSGYLGLAPWNARPGDLICVLLGGSTRFLLRPVPGSTQFKLVGEAYVYGIMGGELFPQGRRPDGLRDFEIV